MNDQFIKFGLSPELNKGLDKMGFQTPTQVQEAAILPMLDGQDLLVQAPTGTGKTCAFGIPAVEMAKPGVHYVQTVILCPTRELAVQTATVLKSLAAYKPGVRIQAVYGGEPIGRQISDLRRKPQILVATPGRLMDHMSRRTVRLETVSQIVLDEADRMLDMGFRDDIKEILRNVPEERQTVLFSATLSADIRQIASQHQRDARKIEIQETGKSVDRVEQYYSQMPSKEKTPALLSLLEEKKFGLSLVFVATKSMADRLSAQLNEKGIKADALHGDLRQSQRNMVMKRYRSGQIRVLVATDVAARGIDVQNIDAVINYDIPGDADSYAHRIGRTGRAGQTGSAYTFVSRQEYGKLKSFMDLTQAKMRKLMLGEWTQPAAKAPVSHRNQNSKPAFRGKSAQMRIA